MVRARTSKLLGRGFESHYSLDKIKIMKTIRETSQPVIDALLKHVDLCDDH